MAVDDLAMQVAGVHYVKVNQPERADPCRRQVHRQR